MLGEYNMNYQEAHEAKQKTQYRTIPDLDFEK